MELYFHVRLIYELRLEFDGFNGVFSWKNDDEFSGENYYLDEACI